MRLNKFVAQATGLSRREADEAIEQNRIALNGKPVRLGVQVEDSDDVKLDGKSLKRQAYQYLLLNKPIGYVSSRKQQDSKPTIYSLIPEEFHHLKPAGRLDADSHGLMLLTNDGDYANQLTHPSTQKTKTYIAKLHKPLTIDDKIAIEAGLQLDDGISSFKIKNLSDGRLRISMHEGRNRQIRRTFIALGYEVVDLCRTGFGNYSIEILGKKVYNTTEKE